MTTLNDVIDFMVASRDWNAGAIGRFGFWNDHLGQRPLKDITPDEVDEVVAKLVMRGKLRPRRGGQCEPTGKPLAPATINRYISSLQSVYKFARKNRLLPRNFTPPTAGIEKAPEPADPERYLRPEDVDKIVAAVRVLDQRWGKLEALIWTGYHTGVRIGNLMELTWADVDLEGGTFTVGKTKNGEPHTAVLSDAAIEALGKLPGKDPDELVFCNRQGKPFHFRSLWEKCVSSVGLPGRGFHQLRHGCGHYLAVNGINQAGIMAHLGHKTLSASARYLHSNTTDKRRVVDRVFNSAT